MTMPINEPFFKRMQRERGEFPTTFQTETLPSKLHGQIVIILNRSIGKLSNSSWNAIHVEIAKVLCEERGIHDAIPVYMLQTWLGAISEPEMILSIVEYAVRLRDFKVNQESLGNETLFNQSYKSSGTTIQMIEDFNIRFRENGYGYQIENLTIVPIDSTYTHSEAVKPAITLMIDNSFRGPLDEFMRAFDAYKSGNVKECIRECSNSIESTLKQIFAENGWEMPKKHTAAFMVEAAMKLGLFPSYMLAHFNALVSTVSSGVPTIGNNAARHGQGAEAVEPPDYMARYVINLTTSALLFLIHAHKDFQRQNPSSTS